MPRYATRLRGLFAGIMLAQRSPDGSVPLMVQPCSQRILLLFLLFCFFVGFSFFLVFGALAVTPWVPRFTILAGEDTKHQTRSFLFSRPARAMAQNPGGRGCRSFPAVSEGFGKERDHFGKRTEYAWRAERDSNPLPAPVLGAAHPNVLSARRCAPACKRGAYKIDPGERIRTPLQLGARRGRRPCE